MFSIAAKQWFESKTALTPLGRADYHQYIGKLNREFGGRLTSDVTADDIAALQRKRIRLDRYQIESLKVSEFIRDWVGRGGRI